MRRNHILNFYTLPLICYYILKMASIEVKLRTSSSQTRKLKKLPGYILFVYGSDLVCFRVRYSQFPAPIFRVFFGSDLVCFQCQFLSLVAFLMPTYSLLFFDIIRILFRIKVCRVVNSLFHSLPLCSLLFSFLLFALQLFALLLFCSLLLFLKSDYEQLAKVALYKRATLSKPLSSLFQKKQL